MLTHSQYLKLETQFEQTSHPDDHETTGTHLQLATVLNKLGYSVVGRYATYYLAQQLLDEYTMSLGDKGE